MRFLGGIWKRKINGETLDYYPCPYMIGDIFITTNNIKPEIRYPGTEWEKLPEETFLMIASPKYPVKSTGGENEVTLSAEQIPEHYHTFGIAQQNNSGSYLLPYGGQRYSDTAQAITSNVGGGQPHNNMPKFYVIYGYKRIA